MKKYHINYAHNGYYNGQKINSESAISVGGFDKSIPHGFDNIDKEFYEKNKHILSQRRGAGYWLWKPYIISKLLNEIEYGDILCYTDSGSEFIKPAHSIFEKLEKTDKGILVFELNSNFVNKDLTKRDCFYYMGLDYEPFVSNIQVLASFIFLKKNIFSMNFIGEWLKYSEDYRIITDLPNECGLKNYEGFVDHRHDQSIFSLLCRKYNISTMPDISQYGNDRRGEEHQIINHFRKYR
jgi:hypothetical protein